MPIKYKVVKRTQVGVKGGGEVKYCASPTKRQIINTLELSGIISSSCSASNADVVMVLQSLSDIIPNLIADGRSVKLNGIGIFSSQFETELKDSPNQVTSRSIKKVKLKFLPDKIIKRALKGCTFKKSS